MRLFRIMALVTLLSFAVACFGWAPGTHAYIANRMPGVTDYTRADVMFGAIVPDINQVLSTDQNSPFFTATHYGFDALWNRAKHGSLADQALGIGFVSHNERIGADRYAHVQSHLYPRYQNASYPGQNGYVWMKSDQLCSLLRKQLTNMNMMNDAAQLLLSDTITCHAVVEYSMDILLKARDPQLGQKLMVAASTYDAGNMAQLFWAGYPQWVRFPGLGNVRMPMGAGMALYTPAWSQLMLAYGNALNQPTTQETVTAVAAFLEFLAEQLLADQLKQLLPPGTTGIPDEMRAQLTMLIELAIVDSMALCALDFNLELEMTVRDVQKNLVKYGATFQPAEF